MVKVFCVKERDLLERGPEDLYIKGVHVRGQNFVERKLCKVTVTAFVRFFKTQATLREVERIEVVNGRRSAVPLRVLQSVMVLRVRM